MRLFLDASVLFSASKSNGAIRDLLARLLQAGQDLVADTYVVAEARRNLAPYGIEAVGALEVLLTSIEVATFRASRLPPDVASVLPPKDGPILAAAIRLRCDALITGDRKHFGPLYGTVQHGVATHSPRSLAEALSL